MTNFEEMRQAMILGQLLPQHISHPKILQGFKRLSRETFVSSSHQNVCYGDLLINMPEDRIILAPVILAKLLEGAMIRPTDKVLVLGCSTGYAAIILSYLANKIIAVESHEPYVNFMREMFENYEIFNAHSYLRSLSEGYGEEAPYDIIFIEGAVADIPVTLYIQLAEGGKIVTIFSKDTITICEGVIIEKRENSLHKKILFETNVPILKEFQKKKDFEF